MHRRPSSKFLPALALLGVLAPAGACVERDKSKPPAPVEEPAEPQRTCVAVAPAPHGSGPGDRDLYDQCIASARAIAGTLCEAKLSLDSREVAAETSSQECIAQWLDGLPGSECTMTTPTSATEWVREVESWPPFAGLGHRCQQLAASPAPERRFLPSCDAAREYLTCLRARHQVTVGACEKQAQSGEPGRTPDGRPMDCYDFDRFGAPELVRTTHTEVGSGFEEVTTKHPAYLDWRWNSDCIDDLWRTLVNCLE